MALWICNACTCRYSVDAPACPQCGADDHHEEGEEMPKITRHGGPSIAGETEQAPAEAPEGAEGTEAAEATVEPVDYDEWSYSELQAECKERGLPASGTKAELVTRLEDDDSTR